ncbi:CUB and sushi domain-containing protein 1 [Caerostris darwini]|uniref:CUB and sushi domain-containing protein 1 n=1 Tax=Caerostris darwini TaxID=1538125 RepID=A0AAV4VY20_9ARAC|nr:CUB and sushi domain-containing protein 1 [Caerostris darwini]
MLHEGSIISGVRYSRFFEIRLYSINVLILVWIRGQYLFAVYCPFPGVLPNGRVLLVGYMGMYDYRPYVKKVTNNRQIMYECHRHYTLVEGPPGATCVDGQWSPKQMPRCVRGSHPVLTTQRRRRELMRNRLRRGGKKRRRRGKAARSKDRIPKESCTLRETDFLEVEIVRMGRGNESLPHGTVINVSCSAGYQLNVRNRTVKCVRGRWKPREPECHTCTKPQSLAKRYATLSIIDSRGLNPTGDK